jgi:translation initiation factor 2 beta subunit (eIF-2beta)/eIF-5
LILRLSKFLFPKPETKEEKKEREATNKTFSPDILKEAKADKKPLSSKIDGQKAVQYAKIIKNAIGTFSDDEAAIFAVFKALKTKVEVQAVSLAYKNLYKQDLLTVLQQNLSKKEMSELNKIIASKPLK